VGKSEERGTKRGKVPNRRGKAYLIDRLYEGYLRKDKKKRKKNKFQTIAPKRLFQSKTGKGGRKGTRRTTKKNPGRRTALEYANDD